MLKSEAGNNKGETYEEKSRLEHAPLLSEKKRQKFKYENRHLAIYKGAGERGGRGCTFSKGKETRIETENDKAFQCGAYWGQFSAERGIKV